MWRGEFLRLRSASEAEEREARSKPSCSSAQHGPTPDCCAAWTLTTEERIQQLRDELVSAKRLIADAADYLHRRNLGQTAEDLKIKLTDKLAEINAVVGSEPCPPT